MENKPVFDFNRPLPQPCKDCGYPSIFMPYGDIYRLKVTECPEHMPQHWKYKKKD